LGSLVPFFFLLVPFCILNSGLFVVPTLFYFWGDSTEPCSENWNLFEGLCSFDSTESRWVPADEAFSWIMQWKHFGGSAHSVQLNHAEYVLRKHSTESCNWKHLFEGLCSCDSMESCEYQCWENIELNHGSGNIYLRGSAHSVPLNRVSEYIYSSDFAHSIQLNRANENIYLGSYAHLVELNHGSEHLFEVAMPIRSNWIVRTKHLFVGLCTVDSTESWEWKLLFEGLCPFDPTELCEREFTEVCWCMQHRGPACTTSAIRATSTRSYNAWRTPSHLWPTCRTGSTSPHVSFLPLATSQ
jgi:hypothetical protein